MNERARLNSLVSLCHIYENQMGNGESTNIEREIPFILKNLLKMD